MSSSFIQRDSLDIYEVGQLVHTRRCQSVQTLHMTVEACEAELSLLAAVSEYAVGDKIHRLDAAVEYDPDFMTSVLTEQQVVVPEAGQILTVTAEQLEPAHAGVPAELDSPRADKCREQHLRLVAKLIAEAERERIVGRDAERL